MTDYLSNHIEQAKLALAEPAGESPPFIIGYVGGYLVEAATAYMTFSQFPWEAGRMSKQDAERRADTLATLTGRDVLVYGWREQTERFIERMTELATVLDPTPRHHPPE